MRAWMLALGLIPAIVASTVLLTISDAEEQAVAKMPRVGILSIGSPSTPDTRAPQVRDELRKLGYVE